MPTGLQSFCSQSLLVFTSIASVAALFTVLGSTITIRNVFAKSVKAIPGLDTNLDADLQDGFTQLVGDVHRTQGQH